MSEIQWLSNSNKGQPKAFVQETEDELDEYYEIMLKFGQMDLDEIFSYLAAWSARAAYLRTLCVRHEGREKMALRTKQIEPFLEEIDRLFKIASRQQTLRQDEWEKNKGFV